ncbi:MAG: 30S ribosomal protein S6 [Chloroflexi bacterium]|nr:30S ribosomal protein S6 [Chloroflexota bacterium]
MVAQRLRDYEIVFILTPEANEDEVEAAVERISAFVTDRGGSFGEHEVWGLRRLAYPINKFMEGIYVLANFSLDASDLLELERSLTTSEDVIRHLVTKAIA